MSQNNFVIDISSDEENFSHSTLLKVMPFNMIEALKT